MEYASLDAVVLDRYLPAIGLKRSGLGAIVQVYEPDGLELEFMTAAGRTGVLVTLTGSDDRNVSDSDLIAARAFARSA